MRNSIILVLAAVLWLVLFASQVPAANVLTPEELNNLKAESKGAQGPSRFRVFALKYLTADEGMQFLADANITNVTQLNDANTLVVNDNQEKLVKAAALLNLVDSREKYIFKSIMPVDESVKLPKNDVIAAEIIKGGVNVSIGTFFNLPGGSGYKAILDNYEGKLVAVAPASIMDKLVEVVQKNISGEAPAEANLPKPQQAAVDMSEPNALYNELLGSIDKAQKEISKASSVLAESNKVKAAVKPEPNQTKSIISGHKEAAEPNADYQKKESETGRSYEPLVIPNADETIELSLPEKMQIIPLLDLVGKYLNLNYIYDEAKLQLAGEVNLKIQGKVKVGELYPLVESVLKFKNLAMTRKGNLVTIVPIAEVMDGDPAFIGDERGEIHAGDIVIARVFHLSYIDNASVKNLLEQMKLGVVTEVSSGTIIVTGYAYRMSRVEEMLDVIDKPGKPKQFKFRQLKYTMAKTLAPKIKGLVEQLGDITISLAKSETPAAQPPGVRRPPIRPTPPSQPQPTPTTGEAAKSTLYLDADERTNRILMIGREDELTVVNDLIDSLDVAQQDLRSLRMYEIQHVGADEVKKKLEELGIIGASKETATPGRITARTVPGQQPGQPPTPTPSSAGVAGAEGELPTEEMQVVVIEATNSLLVNGTPEQHVLIATIISYVDSESISQAIPYVVYPLQNQPPEHVAEVLEKLVTEVVRDEKGKVEKVVKKTEDNIIIVPDPNTFSLIVYASKKNQDWLASLIKTLDRRRPQVLIDVTLVEVTRKNNFDLDLDLASKFPKMLPGGEMTFLPALLGGAGNEAGSTFPPGTQKEIFVSGGQGQAFYSDKHIQALITALESKNFGRVLAKPKILVNDGQKGIIKTTNTKNIVVTGQTLVGGTANSAITTSTSYQAYNAGVTLEIQPNIGEGDLLLLIIKLDRTDFGTSTTPDGPPDTLASTVDTIVTVPNNKTIILGGLLSLNQNKGGSKVPILGDIPLVGGLFRSTSNAVDDSKLYVFVKANILRPEMTIAGLPELERQSEKSRQAFERNEEEFQKYQDWPGIKPQPVDPIKVLEAE